MSVLELRKERSRDAARSRRGKENHEFNQLGKMLPLPHAITMQLDKASIIRLTTAYLKIKYFSQTGLPTWPVTINKPRANNNSNSNHTTNAHHRNSRKSSYDGGCHNISNRFANGPTTNAAVLDSSKFIGGSGLKLPNYIKNDLENLETNQANNILQVEMTGSSIFDYIHIKDQRELAKKLGLDLKWICSTSVPAPPNNKYNNNAYNVNNGLNGESLNHDEFEEGLPLPYASHNPSCGISNIPRNNNINNPMTNIDYLPNDMVNSQSSSPPLLSRNKDFDDDFSHPNHQIFPRNELSLPPLYDKYSDLPRLYTIDDYGTFPEIAFSETIGTMKCKDKYNKVFCVRMKSTLSKRGNHVRQSGYRVLQLLTRFRPLRHNELANLSSYNDHTLDKYAVQMHNQFPIKGSSSPTGLFTKDNVGTRDDEFSNLVGLVGLAIAPPPPALHEIRIDNEMFVMRLSLDLCITSCEPKIHQYTGLGAGDLIKQSFYNFCHVYDLPKLRRQHIDLIKKGQVITDYYRFISKDGGFMWMQTCATVVLNSSKNSPEDEENIIFINYLISNIENKNTHFSLIQPPSHIHNPDEDQTYASKLAVYRTNHLSSEDLSLDNVHTTTLSTTILGHSNTGSNLPGNRLSLFPSSSSSSNHQTLLNTNTTVIQNSLIVEKTVKGKFNKQAQLNDCNLSPGSLMQSGKKKRKYNNYKETSLGHCRNGSLSSVSKDSCGPSNTNGMAITYKHVNNCNLPRSSVIKATNECTGMNYTLKNELPKVYKQPSQLESCLMKHQYNNFNAGNPKRQNTDDSNDENIKYQLSNFLLNSHDDNHNATNILSTFKNDTHL